MVKPEHASREQEHIQITRVLAKSMRLSCGADGLIDLRVNYLAMRAMPGRVSSKHLGGMYCVVHPSGKSPSCPGGGRVLSCGQMDALTVIAIGLRHACRYMMDMIIVWY